MSLFALLKKRPASIDIDQSNDTSLTPSAKRARLPRSPLETSAVIKLFKNASLPNLGPDPNDMIRRQRACGITYFDQFDMTDAENGLVFVTREKAADSKSTAPGPYINVQTRGGSAQMIVASPIGVVKEALLFPDGNFDYDLSLRTKDTSDKYKCQSEISLTGKSWCPQLRGPQRQDLAWIDFAAFLQRATEILVRHIAGDATLFVREKKLWQLKCASMTEVERLAFICDQVREHHVKAPFATYVDGIASVTVNPDVVVNAQSDISVNSATAIGKMTRFFNFSRRLYSRKTPNLRVRHGAQRKSEVAASIPSAQDVALNLEKRRMAMNCAFREDSQTTPENKAAANDLWESATVDLMERELVCMWDLASGRRFDYHSSQNPSYGTLLSVGFHFEVSRGGDNKYHLTLAPHRLFVVGQMENQEKDVLAAEVACELEPVNWEKSIDEDKMLDVLPSVDGAVVEVPRVLALCMDSTDCELAKQCEETNQQNGETSLAEPLQVCTAGIARPEEIAGVAAESARLGEQTGSSSTSVVADDVQMVPENAQGGTSHSKVEVVAAAASADAADESAESEGESDECDEGSQEDMVDE
jgi:hypothetical protein